MPPKRQRTAARPPRSRSLPSQRLEHLRTKLRDAPRAQGHDQVAIAGAADYRPDRRSSIPGVVDLWTLDLLRQYLSIDSRDGSSLAA